VVVAIEEFEVQLDRLASIKDFAYTVEGFELLVGEVLCTWSRGTSGVIQFGSYKELLD